MFILAKKLKFLKGTIRSFNKENYSGLEKESPKPLNISRHVRMIC